MMLNSGAATHLQIVPKDADAFHGKERIERMRRAIGLPPPDTAKHRSQLLPFAGTDATVGVENEFQTVVAGSRDTVDLPLFIQASNFYKNVQKRSVTGDAPLKALQDLDGYLNENPGNIWENSWVNLPRAFMCEYANTVLEADIKADKTRPGGPRRTDASRFFRVIKAREHIRVPVSYLLKLSLVDAACSAGVPALMQHIGKRLMRHFLNDNTSPETYSFYPASADEKTSAGGGIAGETLKRFMLTELLVAYANTRFRLSETGQRVMVYFAPNTPVRQKMLNDLIPDAFYRELFMSPCLSGWDRGEDKYRYMVMCHQVLSRSQLNALGKLKEAGIIMNNLVTLPNTSNTSLTNNGTHVSLGSRTLTRLLADNKSGITPPDEKYFGDLMIKIFEHFLPLFVGTYSAAPYRLDFGDFHPEKVLGFLPHELDYTHIRMIWRRWKKKAGIKLFGRPVTPFGPVWLDRYISKAFCLKGDSVIDFRLIDYLVCLMSTDESPALDGRLGNDERLKRDLSDLGVFDSSMALYLFCRLRQFDAMGFSGMENRIYSQFPSIQKDLAGAADLQQLIAAYAFKCILSGKTGHYSIPDDPFVESERRQVVFAAAIGIPTFYVRKNTKNRMLTGILKHTANTRQSRRYQGYLRVLTAEYARALITVLKTEAADLIELMGMGPLILDLESRIEAPETESAAGRLTREILKDSGIQSPMKMHATEFNTMAEAYYREGLRKAYMREGFDALEEAFVELDSWQSWREGAYNRPLLAIMGGKRPQDFLRSLREPVELESASEGDLKKLIWLTLLCIHRDIEKAQKGSSGD